MKSNGGEFLKKRAKEFWERSKEDFEKSRFNLAVLDIEQSIQLWFKYLIFLKAGDFPKTHYFDVLIKQLSEIYNCSEILQFYQKHALEFRVLEDAYISTRYLPKEFSKEEVRKIMEFAEEVFKFFKKKINEEFV
ncbi:HEPN domain-containing protein [Candidatus Calescamantes bacterium]|nr:HEPN domain-containing protein [Candidatus Calescamantes bacterium]